MKRYSLTDRLPDRLPMTPPDEPPEPDMSRVDACAKCGKDDWIGFCRVEFGSHEGYWRVKCFRCNREGPQAPDLDSAGEAWNKWNLE